MNTAACTFEALVAAVRLHPENLHAEVHAVNLVSILAQMPGGRACVALVHPRNFNRYCQGFERAVYLLESYGVTLHRHWHDAKPAFFLIAKLKDHQPNPVPSAALAQPLGDEQELRRAA